MVNFDQTAPLMCLGIPAQLVAVGEPGLATAEVSGVRREVSTLFVPEAQLGDWVLVHVGFALHTLDEDEAARTLALLEEIEW
jgi:hydrogenase expression/formation protein HypC